MYELDYVPEAKDAVVGDLNGKVYNHIQRFFSCCPVATQTHSSRLEQGQGVIGVRNGKKVIKMFPGALRVLQAIHDGNFPGHARLAVVSSPRTSLAVQIAQAAIDILEVSPGTQLL